MNDGDLFDTVDAGGNTERSERTSGERAERRFDADETMPEVVEVKSAEEPASPVAEEPVRPTEITVPWEDDVPEPRRPAQELPHAASLGASLAELRRQCGLSIEQVACESKIKEHYIEALEADDLAELPQLVFVIAFVKRLCAIYGVSAEDAETLVTELHDQLSYEIPEDLNKTVICREQDEANHRRLRNLTIALVAGAVLILALLILGGSVLVLKLRNGGGTAAPVNEPEVAAQPGPVTVDESMLMSYHERPKLKVTRIPRAK